MDVDGRQHGKRGGLLHPVGLERRRGRRLVHARPLSAPAPGHCRRRLGRTALPPRRLRCRAARSISPTPSSSSSTTSREDRGPPASPRATPMADGQATGAVTDAVYLLMYAFLGDLLPFSPSPRAGRARVRATRRSAARSRRRAARRARHGITSSHRGRANGREARREDEDVCGEYDESEQRSIAAVQPAECRGYFVAGP